MTEQEMLFEFFTILMQIFGTIGAAVLVMQSLFVIRSKYA